MEQASYALTTIKDGDSGVIQKLINNKLHMAGKEGKMLTEANQITSPAVKDGAEERFAKKFLKIQQKEKQRRDYELKARQKRQQEKHEIVRFESYRSYLDSARALAAHWYGVTASDFEEITATQGDLARLDKLLLRKIAKNLAVIVPSAAVMVSAFSFANGACIPFLLSSFFGPPYLLNDIATLIGFIALIVSDIFVVTKLVKYCMSTNVAEAFSFLYHKKVALLVHKESEARRDGI